MDYKKKLLAYIVGVALGDGNLSNPNKRAVRLRITCDNKYPKLIKYVIKTLNTLFPKNKVNTINRITSTDISLYSNTLEKILGWKWNKGPKDTQNIKIPKWIKGDPKFIKECLRGLFQTDGSKYKDRNYLMVNFVNTSPTLVDDIYKLIKNMGYSPNIQKLKQFNGKTKYTIRISRNSEKFIKEIGFWKK